MPGAHRAGDGLLMIHFLFRYYRTWTPLDLRCLHKPRGLTSLTWSDLLTLPHVARTLASSLGRLPHLFPCMHTYHKIHAHTSSLHAPSLHVHTPSLHVHTQHIHHTTPSLHTHYLCNHTHYPCKHTHHPCIRTHHPCMHTRHPCISMPRQ